MNGIAAAATSNPISPVKPNSVVSSSTGGNIRSKPDTTTILPSPAPRDEPSPARDMDSRRDVYEERSARMAPVTRRGMDLQAEELVVRSPEGEMRGQQGQTNKESQAVRSPQIMQSPMMGQQMNTPTESQAVLSLSTQTVRSPLTQQPSPMIQQRNIPTESQEFQSSSTQQPSPTVQQGNLPTSTEQEACRNDDYFYVALHQMFCLWSLDPDLVARLAMPKGGPNLKASFTIIGHLIMQNSAISDAHTKFFSTFPNHLSELMYRSGQYSLTVNNVLIFLTKLSLEWQKYIPECRQRGCPPLVDELVNRFGLLSPILQHIIFTATRRNIGFPDDEYSAQMEQLFNRDQELHHQMAARVNTAYPPTKREIHERNQWQAGQYAHVRAAQLRRLEEGRRIEMAQMPSNAPTSHAAKHANTRTVPKQHAIRSASRPATPYSN
ncbi:hypothetical protein ACLOAV_004633 [Pseudogymnoascus australis]